MRSKIEHPKVFISYAWGSQEHDEKVIALATNLKRDGVEVVFDKWQLKEGNDTYSFMEKSVLDESITNVLILIDPIYSKKANERKGGVGTETQIISSEVYNKVEQSKFIPVVFERDEKGSICKPQYLKGLLHFDLSMPDNYDTEYQRMIRTLYGIATYKEPELGKPPAWLEESPKVSYKSRVTSDFFRGTASNSAKKNKYCENLEDLKAQILRYEFEGKEIVSCYLELIPLRDEFLLLVKNAEYVSDGYKQIATFLEGLSSEIKKQRTYFSVLKAIFVHECFIYIVAYWLKKGANEALRYILNKTYFTGESSYAHGAESFHCFYCSHNVLDDAVCKRDNKDYYCGTAALWIEQLNVEMCNKDEFVLGDLFLHSASFLVSNYEESWAWFPVTYIYQGDEYGSFFASYSKRLISREHLENMMYILGYESIDKLKEQYKKVEEMFEKTGMREYRYNNCFEVSKNFWNYVKTDELGIRN